MDERNILFLNLEHNCDWDVLVDPPDHLEVTQALWREQNRVLMREARQGMTLEQRQRQRANDRERKKTKRLNTTLEQRASERERKQTARLNTTSEQRTSDRERKKTARLNATPEQRARERARQRNRPRRCRLPRQLNAEQRERRRQRSRNRLRPFWGVDGEGAGTDDKGRQPYILMAASGPGADEHRIVHRDGAALSVRDCLEFLLSLPPDPILVGFAFGYDANQIIRGMKIETQTRIIHPPRGEYGSPLSTFWADYAITWQPWQYFRVSRVDRSTGKAVVDTNTTRTVYDVIGFFQCSFVSALETWNIGSEQERAFVAEMKDKRREFVGLPPETIDYCVLECRNLALLMSEFRKVCIEADTVPERWCGAGWMAASVLKKHGIPKRPPTANEALRVSARPQLRRPERDSEFERAANEAYYGGRFEVSTIGHIAGPIYEYDVNSAYPQQCPGCRARCIPDGCIVRTRGSCRKADSIWRKSHSTIGCPCDGAACRSGASNACIGLIREPDGTGHARSKRPGAASWRMFAYATFGWPNECVIAASMTGCRSFMRSASSSGPRREAIPRS